jgi:hypothetical protein
VDLRRLELDFSHQRARVTFADAAGEHAHVLEGAAWERVEAAAAALLAALESQIGGACHLELQTVRIDPPARVLDVQAGEAHRFAGPAYDALTRQGRAVTDVARAAANEAGNVRPEGPGSPSEVRFWSEAYHTHHDGWELARVAPPLARAIGSLDVRGKRAVVVGCGRGHEAALLAPAGASVVAVDFAPEALAEARRLYGSLPIDWRQRDLFLLARDPEKYDLWVEHCCFCAIDPARRDEYVQVAREVIAPGGELIGLFWAHGRPGGPPFGLTRAELEARFSPRFELVQVEVPPDSVALRAGQELLAHLRRR